MAKRKPCKPKPKMTDEEINYLYELTLGNPKQAHVLCPVHIK